MKRNRDFPEDLEVADGVLLVTLAHPIRVHLLTYHVVVVLDRVQGLLPPGKVKGPARLSVLTQIRHIHAGRGSRVSYSSVADFLREAGLVHLWHRISCIVST